MQFLVTGRDGDDADALARRMAARAAHLELGDRMVAAGRHLFAVALLNDSGTMIGSVLIVDFASRVELDEWLAVEPYVTGDVWRSVDVQPVRVGPSFGRIGH
jgi:uncharacterized protein YciI